MTIRLHSPAVSGRLAGAFFVRDWWPFWYNVSMDDLLSRITINPAICHGKPTIRGLRYPVETLLELLSSGMTFEEILADYEDLDRGDLLAALAFAARLVRTGRLQPVST